MLGCKQLRDNLKVLERKKVLFLTYCYPPQQSPRAIQINHLQKVIGKHYEVKVITSVFKYEENNPLLKFANISNVIFAEKSKTTLFFEKIKGNKIKKKILIDYAYFWHFDLVKRAIKVIDSFKPDMFITFGQPMSTHIAGLKLKKKYRKIKWIAHFSDPWVDNIFNEYGFLVKMLSNYYQNKVAFFCDRIIFTSKETIKLVTKKYSQEVKSKSIYMPHIFDNSFYPKEINSRNDSKILIRYLGNFYGRRTPTSLLNAISLLPKSILNIIKVEFIGGSQFNIIKDIERHQLKDVVFFKDKVNYLDSLVMMKEADLLLIIDAPIDESPFLPSKLIDYIGADKPIFGVTPEGTSKRLIEKMGFKVANPNNISEISKKLSFMIKSVQNNKNFTIPEEIKNNFDISKISNKIIKIFDSILLPN